MRDVGGVEAAKARAWKALCGLEWRVDRRLRRRTTAESCRQLQQMIIQTQPDLLCGRNGAQAYVWCVCSVDDAKVRPRKAFTRPEWWVDAAGDSW